MAKVAPTFDAIWFAKHQGFCNDSKDVLSLTNVDVNIENINNFSRPRLNKSCWK
jgi:hypothetical protein